MKVIVNLLTTYKLGLPDLCLFDKNTHTYKTLTLRYFLIVQEASFFFYNNDDYILQTNNYTLKQKMVYI